MKKYVTVAAGGLLALALTIVAGLGSTSAAPVTRLAIATGGTGGVYFPLGGGLASLLSRNISGITATAEVTPASGGEWLVAHLAEAPAAFHARDVPEAPGREVWVCRPTGAALVLGYVTQRLGLSPIVGYLLAGVIVGPHTPGFAANVELACLSAWDHEEKRPMAA